MNKPYIRLLVIVVILLPIIGIKIQSDLKHPETTPYLADTNNELTDTQQPEQESDSKECIHLRAEGIPTDIYWKPRQGVIDAVWPNSIVLGNLGDDIGYSVSIFKATQYPEFTNRSYPLGGKDAFLVPGGIFAPGYLGYISAGSYSAEKQTFLHNSKLELHSTTTPQGIQGWYAYGKAYADQNIAHNYFIFNGIVEDGEFIMAIIDQETTSEQLFYELLGGVNFTIEEVSGNPIRGEIKTEPCNYF